MTVNSWTDIKPSKGDFEPLVSQETFDRVQQILSGRKGPSTTHIRCHPDFPLRHFVRCGYCQKPLTGSWSKNRKKVPYGYYRCYSPTCKKINVRREKMENAFTDYLEILKPCTEFLALFEAVVMDVWESSRVEMTTLVASLKGQLTTLEEKRELLDETFIYKKSIDQSTYDREKGKLAAAITAKQIELGEAEIDEFDIEGAISFARHMLENAATLWGSFPHDLKERFQRVIFPEGLTFADGKFGTTATNSIFSHLHGALAECSLTDKFWVFYRPNAPELRNIMKRGCTQMGTFTGRLITGRSLVETQVD